MLRPLLLALLIALFLWLALNKLQELLSKWRLKRSGDPEAELIIDENSGWNLFIKRLFGFLRLIVVLVSALFLFLFLSALLQAG